jgi:hypothetical protein
VNKQNNVCVLESIVSILLFGDFAFPLERQVGVLPYGEAVVCIANMLVALCLNNGGLQRVKDSRAMECFVPLFTSRKYSK